jgi:hypothetical protein
MDTLAQQNLLSAAGWLRPAVQVVCVGDYVDYESGDPERAGLDGMAFLAWLSAHDSRQTVLLIGPRDIERVCSLAAATSASMLAARLAAVRLLRRGDRAARRAFLRSWVTAHPSHPPLLAARECTAWHPGQASLYRRLLLAGRLVAATVVTVAGMEAPALVTHAGVTRQWLQAEDLPADPAAIAACLNRDLAAAVDDVRPSWASGGNTPLAFRHHAAWEPLRPASGVLVHRPRTEPAEDRRYHHLGLAEPRYDPAPPMTEFLVPGLVQVVGHYRTLGLWRAVGTWGGRYSFDRGVSQPLAIDLIAEAGEVVAPLTERLGRPIHSRVIATHVGLGSRPCEWVRLVSLTQVADSHPSVVGVTARQTQRGSDRRRRRAASGSPRATRADARLRTRR